MKLFGHPVHPMLIVFPLGLLSVAFIFDILYLLLNNVAFSLASYWMIAAGLVGGVLAAITGALDWLSIPGGTRAKSVGLWHGLGNAVVLGLFGISWFLRMDVSGYPPNGAPFLFELIATLIVFITAWLGGELVYRMGMSVDEGAHLDSPSSLSDEPASSSSKSN